MKTLIELLSGAMRVERNWAIYAQKINGEFAPNSPARFGQTQFVNGGVADNFEIFANCEYITDKLSAYLADVEPEFEADFMAEAGQAIIDRINGY